MGNLNVTQFTSSIGSPAKTFLWEVIIPRFDALGNIRAQTAQFPGEDSTEMELFFQGQKCVFPGSIEFEHTWAAVFAESEKGDFYAELKAWRKEIFDKTAGTAQPPDEVKERITIRGLKAADGEPWIEAILLGAYPKTIDALDLDRSANTESWKWNVTFSYDSWI